MSGSYPDLTHSTILPPASVPPFPLVDNRYVMNQDKPHVPQCVAQGHNSSFGSNFNGSINVQSQSVNVNQPKLQNSSHFMTASTNCHTINNFGQQISCATNFIPQSIPNCNFMQKRSIPTPQLQLHKQNFQNPNENADCHTNNNFARSPQMNSATNLVPQGIPNCNFMQNQSIHTPQLQMNKQNFQNPNENADCHTNNNFARSPQMNSATNLVPQGIPNCNFMQNRPIPTPQLQLNKQNFQNPNENADCHTNNNFARSPQMNSATNLVPQGIPNCNFMQNRSIPTPQLQLHKQNFQNPNENADCHTNFPRQMNSETNLMPQSIPNCNFMPNRSIPTPQLQMNKQNFQNPNENADCHTNNNFARKMNTATNLVPQSIPNCNFMPNPSIPTPQLQMNSSTNVVPQTRSIPNCNFMQNLHNQNFQNPNENADDCTKQNNVVISTSAQQHNYQHSTQVVQQNINNRPPAAICRVSISKIPLHGDGRYILFVGICTTRDDTNCYQPHFAPRNPNNLTNPNNPRNPCANSLYNQAIHQPQFFDPSQNCRPSFAPRGPRWQNEDFGPRNNFPDRPQFGQRKYGHRRHRNKNPPPNSQRDKSTFAHYCDVCDRGFDQENQYTEHTDSHIKCKVEGCTYAAGAKLVTSHYEQQHKIGLPTKTWAVESDEEIQKWREERKRKFPTATNVQTKQADQDDREKRGEVLQTREFGKMKKKQHSNASIPRHDPKGQGQTNTEEVKCSPERTKGEDGNDGTADETKSKSLETTVAVEQPINNDENSSINAEKDVETKPTGNKLKRIRKRPQKKTKKPLPNKDAVHAFTNNAKSLLQKLLAPEIRHERNVILQCVRYVVSNNFFDGKNISPDNGDDNK